MAVGGRDLLELIRFLSGSDDASVVERMDSTRFILGLIRLEAFIVLAKIIYPSVKIEG